MPIETFIALSTFAFVSSMTPGPNNIMLMASGVNFGFRRTIPHMLGVCVGFMILIMAVGLGLGTLLTIFPWLHTALKIAGAGYLCYLAWKIASSRTMATTDGAAKPLTFLQAAAFQWVNPKAWVASVSGVAVYTTIEAPFLSMLIVVFVFSLVSVPSVTAWTAFGQMLRQFLSDPVRLKWFNISMGILLALSIWPMLQ
ncbi:LysE family translocator [Rhizobium sp. EC-SD404]|uniref:LysE family translocator n=1 Tax=Rhizobium sp. EC-SD404 TaxID=2038389 RepID=UPI001250D147|nr:LysE family translocator [Rhizobium sp. EC-SD404]VVT25922.1 Lysine transporter LysE [Rhizobium sp. EC-SD404]